MFTLPRISHPSSHHVHAVYINTAIIHHANQQTFHCGARKMTSKLMGKLKETLGNDTRPAIPLAHPEAASGSAPREIQSSPRVQFKGSRYVMCKTKTARRLALTGCQLDIDIDGRQPPRQARRPRRRALAAVGAEPAPWPADH